MLNYSGVAAHRASLPPKIISRQMTKRVMEAYFMNSSLSAWGISRLVDLPVGWVVAVIERAGLPDAKGKD